MRFRLIQLIMLLCPAAAAGEMIVWDTFSAPDARLDYPLPGFGRDLELWTDYDGPGGYRKAQFEGIFVGRMGATAYNQIANGQLQVFASSGANWLSIQYGGLIPGDNKYVDLELNRAIPSTSHWEVDLKIEAATDRSLVTIMHTKPHVQTYAAHGATLRVPIRDTSDWQTLVIPISAFSVMDEDGIFSLNDIDSVDFFFDKLLPAETGFFRMSVSEIRLVPEPSAIGTLPFVFIAVSLRTRPLQRLSLVR